MNNPIIYKTFTIDGGDGWWIEVKSDDEGTAGIKIIYKEKDSKRDLYIFVPKEYIHMLIECLKEFEEKK